MHNKYKTKTAITGCFCFVLNDTMHNMTPEELKQLAEKAAVGTLTQEEELKLLKELNQGAESLIELIRTVKEEDK